VAMAKNRAPATQLRAVVHIGPIKTGSTAFTAQMTASQSRGDLGQNIVYALPRKISRNNELKNITPEQIRYLAPKLEWSRQSGESGSTEKGSNTVFGERAKSYLDDLAKEVRALPGSDATVFFVEETLSRRSGPGNLTAELLARFDAVDYVLVARAQQFIVPSAISQRVKVSAYPSVWDARVSTFLSNENLANQFDYAKILDRWASNDPRVRVLVVPFLESDRGTQNLFYRILEVVGVSTSLGEPVQAEINVTPSRFEIAAVGAYKRATYWISRRGLPRRSRRRYAFELASSAFRQIAKVIRSPRWTLSNDDLTQVVNYYRSVNAQFLVSLGVIGRTAEWLRWADDAEVHRG